MERAWCLYHYCVGQYCWKGAVVVGLVLESEGKQETRVL